MMPLGESAPNFQLPDTRTDQQVALADLLPSKRGLLVIFMCNHCPYVIHVMDQLVQLEHDYLSKGIAFVGISSNNIETHPDDSPEKMKTFADEYGFDFPYLYDESQEVALAYRAACTPDFFLFNADAKLVYRGQLDGSRPKSGKPITGADLRRALDTLLAGEPPVESQLPSAGCNIKWKPGNEPDYFPH
jgi:peroxiredoxin